MIAIRPTTPDNKLPVEKPVKHSLWSKIVSYTANDQDYTPTLKIAKTAAPKKRNLWRQIKAALTIILIGYLLLCTYVLLNPENALFFNNILGVQYLTVRTVLQYTIYVVYSVFGLFLWFWFLFFGYRAFAIRTKSRGKKAGIWAVTVMFCLVFFGNIALFAVTYDWFRRIDFNNLDGRVLIYNNALLKYMKPTDDVSGALIDADVKIGPLQVRYDMSAYIKKRAFLEGLVFTRPYTFEIDYDGDSKPDRGTGKNNGVEYPITDVEFAPVVAPDFNYDEAREYAPKATIAGTDVAGKPIKFDLEIPKISLDKIVKIGRNVLSDGGIQYSFDASTLSDLGQVRWSIVGSDTKKDGYQFSPDKIFVTPTIICMQIFRGSAPLHDTCDWRFVTEESTKSNIQNTTIDIKIDPINPLKYQFSMEPTTIQWGIKAIRWYIDGQIYVGKFDSGFERIFDYVFHKPGTYKIDAEIEDTLWNIVRVGTPGPIYTAELVDLKEWFTLSIQDETGADLGRDTFDKTTQTYLLADFPVPGILHLDATKIRANSARLRLTKVEWDMNNDGIYESDGLSIDQPIDLPGRFDFRARYTFTDLSVDGHDLPILHIDRLAVVWVQKPLDVRVKITPDDEYAPTSVRFDASGSKIQKGEIKKFLYDFGDGRKYEWEGVVTTYKYAKPGEYKITVTAVTNTGSRASKTYTLVLKKPQETVHIQPSIASGLAESGLPITFDTRIQGNNSIVYWDFGDGSGIITGTAPVHEFRDPGTYTITVRVEYTTGIEETDSIKYIVQ